MRAICDGIIAAILILFLGYGLLVCIGYLTNSAPGGICGPTGKFGGILFLSVFALPFVSIVGGVYVGIKSVRKSKLMRNQKQTHDSNETKNEGN
jgi:hypothetical protein